MWQLAGQVVTVSSSCRCTEAKPPWPGSNVRAWVPEFCCCCCCCCRTPQPEQLVVPVLGPHCNAFCSIREQRDELRLHVKFHATLETVTLLSTRNSLLWNDMNWFIRSLMVEMRENRSLLWCMYRLEVELMYSMWISIQEHFKTVTWATSKICTVKLRRSIYIFLLSSIMNHDHFFGILRNIHES